MVMSSGKLKSPEGVLQGRFNRIMLAIFPQPVPPKIV